MPTKMASNTHPLDEHTPMCSASVSSPRRVASGAAIEGTKNKDSDERIDGVSLETEHPSFGGGEVLLPSSDSSSEKAMVGDAERKVRQVALRGYQRRRRHLVQSVLAERDRTTFFEFMTELPQRGLFEKPA